MCSRRCCEEVYERAEKEDLRIALSDGLKEEIIQAGAVDARFGARPLRRAVQRFVEDVIAEGVLGGGVDRDKAHHVGLWRRFRISDPERQAVLCCTSRRCSFGGVEAAKDAELRSAMPNLPFDVVDDVAPLEAAVPSGGSGGGLGEPTQGPDALYGFSSRA